MLKNSVYFDAIMVQFYNNYCGINSFVPGQSTQWNFNFETWDQWAQTHSKNKAVKILLGVPANAGAGRGYLAPDKLDSVIKYSSQYSSFGGVMMWDASQAWANNGFIGAVDMSLSTPKKRAMRWGGRSTE
jgi:chitinase